MGPEVHDNLYVTPRKPLDRRIRTGRDILLDIDVQGARKIKRRYPRAVSFSFAAVFERVETPAVRPRHRRYRVVRRRLANAQGEMGKNPV